MGKKRSRRALLGVLTAVGVVLGVTAAVGIATTASADVRAAAEVRADCDNPTITVTETVMTDPGSPLVPAVPALWANFQPNDAQTVFNGPPSYPSDALGEWIVHENDGGPGQDQSGVYNIGDPTDGGNWFYRQQAADEIPAVDPTFEDVSKEVRNPDFPCPKKPGKKKPPTTTTINKPDKVIKITEEGDRVVTEFEGSMIEEGL